MEPILLRVSEVGPLLGVSRSKAYELIAGGQIPCVRLGNSLRVPLAELRAWVAGQTGANHDHPTTSVAGA